ncbi:PREDICTED: nucleolar and coiled-body phosphoprotein 1-like [Erythranthe guttata]|uniref:nucleolar and coiled-body phosphoprotein 1-like n=1 Tax=Erythranthe guttata TaxID=4155 RepID=UPI00064D9BE0|nr:PREDICTED: nucleolar and coiled-body phosphoprotein 1-like [Erythranthe guttata]|eukprot:XP_012837998.1 PREDICTED: nucleolar and coiled-body phosphoprotein 1-like [Erythranthe guttata]
MASPPRNPIPAAVGDVHNDAAAPDPADPNMAIIVRPVKLEAMPISFIEPGDEMNPIDPDNFQNVGEDILPAEAAEVEEEAAESVALQLGQTHQEAFIWLMKNMMMKKEILLLQNQAQALSSSSTDSSSKDSPPPASTQGETFQSNMAATPSQHPVSEDVAAHVPENAAAPTVSDNASQNVAEDAAPYQDEEMPDLSGMSFAEHVDITTADAEDFATTEETSLPTPSAPNEDPLETLAEAVVQVDAPPSQAEEEKKSDDKSDSDSSEDSSQMEEDAAPPVASPEPTYIPDELEDSEEDESPEEEELDLDVKDLSTPIEFISPIISAWWKCFREHFLIKKGENKLVMKLKQGEGAEESSGSRGVQAMTQGELS